MREILGKVLAKAIKGDTLHEAIVADKTDDPIAPIHAVCRPTEKADIHIVELGKEGSLRVLLVGLAYPLVNFAILAIFVVVVLAHLPRVVGGVANDDQQVLSLSLRLAMVWL